MHKPQGEFKHSWIDTWWMAGVIALAIVAIFWLALFNPKY